MWKELGIIGGTAIIVLAALYFVIKWAVKSGMKEAYEEISGKEIKDDLDEILEKRSWKGKKEKTQKGKFQLPDFITGRPTTITIRTSQLY